MQVESLEDAMRAAPFEIQLDNGTKLPVKHSDFCCFSEDRQTIVVFVGKHYHVVPIKKITTIKSGVK
jgi:hypothetical protein